MNPCESHRRNGQVTYEPSVLIDVATLTGSAGRALGDDYAAVFGRHDELIEQLTEASSVANEAIWRLTPHAKAEEILVLVGIWSHSGRCGRMLD